MTRIFSFRFPHTSALVPLVTHLKMRSSLAPVICIILIAAGNAVVFGQRVQKQVLPGSAPFTESFEDMIRRDQQRQIVPGATPEFRLAPEEMEEIPSIKRTVPSDNEFQAPVSPVTEAPQTIGTAFPGASLTDEFTFSGTGNIPPDTMGAIGPSHFMETLNGAVAVNNRSGV